MLDKLDRDSELIVTLLVPSIKQLIICRRADVDVNKLKCSDVHHRQRSRRGGVHSMLWPLLFPIHIDTIFLDC